MQSNCTKNSTPGYVLSNYAACLVCVTIFSTGGKFRLVSNFTELHALTLATCFYAFLVNSIAVEGYHIDTNKC